MRERESRRWDVFGWSGGGWNEDESWAHNFHKNRHFCFFFNSSDLNKTEKLFSFLWSNGKRPRCAYLFDLVTSTQCVPLPEPISVCATKLTRIFCVSIWVAIRPYRRARNTSKLAASRRRNKKWKIVGKIYVLPSPPNGNKFGAGPGHCVDALNTRASVFFPFSFCRNR